MARSVEYAEYKDGDPKTWTAPEPSFNLEAFNKRLEDAGGRMHFRPRYRCRWGGKAPEYLIEDFDEQTGWLYRQDGQDVFIPMSDTETVIPANAIVAPVYEHIKVFVPRYLIEELREDGNYHFGFWIEEERDIANAYGRRDVISYYREPSEYDIQICRHARYNHEALTQTDINQRIAQDKAREQKARDARREEFVETCAEDFTQAITDGVPNAPELDPDLQFSPQFIQEYSRALTAEHNKNL